MTRQEVNVMIRELKRAFDIAPFERVTAQEPFEKLKI